MLRIGQSRRIARHRDAARGRGDDRAPTGVIAVTTRQPVAADPVGDRVPASTATCCRACGSARREFRPSDFDPAVLRVRAGGVVGPDGVQIVPLSRLDVLLYSGGGKFVGALARLRDLLPGVYSFGITGRGPTGTKLAPGAYQLRLVAWPVDGGKPTPVARRPSGSREPG